jgi:hypothetical protein
MSDPTNIPDVTGVNMRPICLVHMEACLDENGLCSWPLDDDAPTATAVAQAAHELHLPPRFQDDTPVFRAALAAAAHENGGAA